MQLRLPPPLRFRSVVAIVAPAGPFDRDTLFRGLAWLGTRYRLRGDCRLLSRQGYFAGSDDLRANLLAAAMTDPEVEAIYCARGGYGAMRIVDALPWNALLSSPKWIVGFSDVTALHVVANAHGLASIHAPNVTGLGVGAITPAERASLLSALEATPARSQMPWTGLRTLFPGDADGMVVGGNLALVASMAAAGRLVIPQGALLLLEDVTERPYRIDRMLTSLLLGGYLARASAIVFGSFTECEPNADGTTVDDVLRDRTEALGIPVRIGAPFGHGAPNYGFRLGARARLRGDRLEFG